MGASCGRVAVAESGGRAADAVAWRSDERGGSGGGGVQPTGGGGRVGVAPLRLPSPSTRPLPSPLTLSHQDTNRPAPVNDVVLPRSLYPTEDIGGDGGGGGGSRRSPCGCGCGPSSVPTAPALFAVIEELRRSALGRAVDLLPPGLSRRFSRLWHARHVCAGESIFTPGQPARSLFYVRSGCVRIALDRAVLPDGTATATPPVANAGVSKLSCRRVASTGSLSDDPASAAPAVAAALLPVIESAERSATVSGTASLSVRSHRQQSQQQRELRSQRRASLGTPLPRSVTEHAERQLGSSAAVTAAAAAAATAAVAAPSIPTPDSLVLLMLKRVGEMFGLESLHALDSPPPADADTDADVPADTDPPPSCRRRSHALAEGPTDVLELSMADLDHFLAEMHLHVPAENDNAASGHDGDHGGATTLDEETGGKILRPKAHRLAAPSSFAVLSDAILTPPTPGGAHEEIRGDANTDVDADADAAPDALPNRADQQPPQPQPQSRPPHLHVPRTESEVEVEEEEEVEVEGEEGALAEETLVSTRLEDESCLTHHHVAGSEETSPLVPTRSIQVTHAKPAPSHADSLDSAAQQLARQFRLALQSCGGSSHAAALAPHLPGTQCPTLLQLVASLFDVVHCPAGHALMREGESGQYLPAASPAATTAPTTTTTAGTVYVAQSRVYFPLQGQLACSIRGNPDSVHVRFHKLFDAGTWGAAGTTSAAAGATSAAAAAAAATAAVVPGPASLASHRAQSSSLSTSSSCSLMSGSSASTSFFSTSNLFPPGPASLPSSTATATSAATATSTATVTGLSTTAAPASALSTASSTALSSLAPSPSFTAATTLAAPPFSCPSMPPSPRLPYTAAVAAACAGKVGVHPGFFGEIGALFGALRTATITTHTPCVLLELPTDRLRALLLLVPALAATFITRFQRGHLYHVHVGQLLGVPSHARAFVAWVQRREHSGENYNFWHEARSFRLGYSRHLLSQRNRQSAAHILERYVLPGAETPVNLSATIVGTIMARWARDAQQQQEAGGNQTAASGPSSPIVAALPSPLAAPAPVPAHAWSGGGNSSSSSHSSSSSSHSEPGLPGLDADLFLEAEQEVLCLMNNDSFPRFRTSDVTTRLCAEAIQAHLDGTAATGAAGVGATGGGSAGTSPSTPNSARRHRPSTVGVMPGTKRAQSSASLGQFDARMLQRGHTQGQAVPPTSPNIWLGSPSRALRMLPQQQQQPLSASPLARSPGAALHHHSPSSRSSTSSTRHRLSQSLGVLGWGAADPVSRQCSPGVLAAERSPRLRFAGSACPATGPGSCGVGFLQRGVSLGGTVSSVPELPDGSEAAWERERDADAAPHVKPTRAPFAASNHCAAPAAPLESGCGGSSSWLAVGGAVSFHLSPSSLLLHTAAIEPLDLPSAPLSAVSAPHEDA